MYAILEYLALVTAVVVAATVVFGVASLFLVIGQGARRLAVSSRRLFLLAGGLFSSGQRPWSKPEVAFWFDPRSRGRTSSL